MKIAICGITGVVGKETLRCLVELNIPVTKLTCFASERSAGKEINTPFGTQQIVAFNEDVCRDYDFVFLCISGSFSESYGRKLSTQNKYVIDNSSHFRYDDDVPLVIPEINGKEALESSLIANPNCTTSILVMALYPLYKEFGLKKTIISTYQATSGAGYSAMEELKEETRNYLEGKKVSSKKFTYPIPFNLIPAIDTFNENGYTKEEMKVVWETRKIFGNKNLNISVTAVRIPTFRAHAESVTIETEKVIDPVKAREVFKKSPGLKLLDDPSMNIYPMPLSCTEQFDVEVGRIRQNLIFEEHGLDFFICGDQLLKGAALNTVQIAKYIIENS